MNLLLIWIDIGERARENRKGCEKEKRIEIRNKGRKK